MSKKTLMIPFILSITAISSLSLSTAEAGMNDIERFSMTTQIRQEVQANTISLTGSVSCLNGNSNGGTTNFANCKMLVTDHMNGRVYRLSDEDDVRKLANKGMTLVFITGRHDGTTLAVNNVAPAR